MSHSAKEKLQSENNAKSIAKTKVHPAISALIRVLARQAAEEDFKAMLKLQEAANDNDQ